jgi:hypothetical protein
MNSDPNLLLTHHREHQQHLLFTKLNAILAQSGLMITTAATSDSAAAGVGSRKGNHQLHYRKSQRREGSSIERADKIYAAEQMASNLLQASNAAASKKKRKAPGDQLA